MKALFRPGDLISEQPAGIPFLNSDAPGVFINAASLKYFKSQLADIEPNKHYHFNTGGQWSMHELLEYLLNITGPADIFISTWAISEDPVRALMEMKNVGYIRNIKCIFDYKIKEQKSKAFLLAEQNFDKVKLDKCHAKVTVITNASWGITIPGSANYTRNPRIERGIVCTDPEAAEFDLTWMNAILNGEPFFKVRGT
jgi:hypothetical protein